MTSPAKAKKRIVVIDDHPVVRRGLSGLLNEEADLCVQGEAESCREALPAIARHRPELVVLDISFPDGDGIDLCRKIRARHPRLPILIMSIHGESLYAARALRAGANGYIMKHEAPEKIVSAIRHILGGNIHVSESTVQKILGRPARSSGVAGADSPGAGLDLLTQRELEVFTLIGHGRSTKQIAQELSLGPKTVETHRINIKKKLKIRHLPELVKQAVEWLGASRYPA